MNDIGLCKKSLMLIINSVTLGFLGLLFQNSAYAAVYQILNDYFYQNPAELSQTHETQLILGNIFAIPSMEFDGQTPLGSGIASSKVNNSLPYVLTSHRFTDKWVAGFNATPSAYGHINWGDDSIVSNSSTVTNMLYYQFGFQSGYQFDKNLSLGAGFNVEYNKFAELNYMTPPLGNQVNKIQNGVNYVGDFGIYYKLNTYNYLTASVYTQVSTYGHGISTLGTITSNDFSLNILQPPIAYIGLQQISNENLFLEEKVYFSGWHIVKNIDFINSATGSFSTPANWRDTWSFQISARYVLTEKWAILGSGIYETNAVPTATNQIGYPVSSSGSLTAGLDAQIMKEISVQVMYSYGGFIPDAMIANPTMNGTVSANTQSFVVQLIYKI